MIQANDHSEDDEHLANEDYLPARMVNEFVYCPRLSISCGRRAVCFTTQKPSKGRIFIDVLTPRQIRSPLHPAR